MFKSVRIVTSFEDITVMGNSIKQGGGHFFITEDLYPLSEIEVSNNNQWSLLIQMANKTK